MTLVTATRLGPYEIQSALGAGGMGEVYKARDTRLDRIVAIKILPEALAGDPQFRERFDREARTISQLEHPHIGALYDVGEQDGTLFLVMQYLDGEALQDRLVKGALPLDDAEVVRDREARIRRYVADLRDFAEMPEATFLETRERQYAVLHALQLAIEASVDIATHICAADNLGVPSSYAEAFDLLEQAAVVDRALAEDLRNMARLRNRIVHFYGHVDLRTVYRLLHDRLSDFDRYLRRSRPTSAKRSAFPKKISRDRVMFGGDTTTSTPRRSRTHWRLLQLFSQRSLARIYTPTTSAVGFSTWRPPRPVRNPIRSRRRRDG